MESMGLPPAQLSTISCNSITPLQKTQFVAALGIIYSSRILPISVERTFHAHTCVDVPPVCPDRLRRALSNAAAPEDKGHGHS
jgi:hypothetical protein